jgi:hypothetical protein
MMYDEHMRYLGALGLLMECSVYVPEDLRECIESAFQDACAANDHWKWRRILNRIEIIVMDDDEVDEGEESREKIR